MQVEHFLFTRTEKQDFTAFIRPADMSLRDVSMIGGTFNYITDISRLTPEFPSLYCFPLGEHYFLLRHYNSGRAHAGRAIGVIEGIAVKQTYARTFARALPYCVLHQQEVLLAYTGNIETLTASYSAEHALEHNADPSTLTGERGFVREFLSRSESDRLFLPFNRTGLNMLVLTLADQPYATPLLFAFGTNSDVVGQFLTRELNLDVVSFFNTESPCFRSRDSNQKTGDITDFTVVDEPETVSSNGASIAIRASASTAVRIEPIPTEQSDLRRTMRQSRTEPEDDESAGVMTMRQMRDQRRAEEAALNPVQEARHSSGMFGWLARLWNAITGHRS